MSASQILVKRHAIETLMFGVNYFNRRRVDRERDILQPLAMRFHKCFQRQRMRIQVQSVVFPTSHHCQVRDIVVVFVGVDVVNDAIARDIAEEVIPDGAMDRKHVLIMSAFV